MVSPVKSDAMVSDAAVVSAGATSCDVACAGSVAPESAMVLAMMLVVIRVRNEAMGVILCVKWELHDTCAIFLWRNSSYISSFLCLGKVGGVVLFMVELEYGFISACASS